MQLHLYRRRIGGIASDGILSINDKCICHTAENSMFRPPVGTYHIVLEHSKEFGRKMPLLVEAPNACLAFGNGIYGSTDGRILLGTYVSPGVVKHSREPFMLLYDRIKKSLSRGHEVTLEVTENSYL